MTGTGVAPNYRCPNCGVALCDCTDDVWSRTATIDDRSEPGAWARHIRDTACMRGTSPSSGSDAPASTLGAGLHGSASISSTPPAAFPGDRDGTGFAPAAHNRVNAALDSGHVGAVKPEPVAPSFEPRP